MRIEFFAADFAVFDVNDAVGHAGDRLVVRNDDDRFMIFAADLLQKFEDIFSRFVVERARRLVSK